MEEIAVASKVSPLGHIIINPACKVSGNIPIVSIRKKGKYIFNDDGGITRHEQQVADGVFKRSLVR